MVSYRFFAILSGVALVSAAPAAIRSCDQGPVVENPAVGGPLQVGDTCSDRIQCKDATCPKGTAPICTPFRLDETSRTCQCSGPDSGLNVCIPGNENNPCGQLSCSPTLAAGCNPDNNTCECLEKPEDDGTEAEHPAKDIGDTCAERSECASITSCPPGEVPICGVDKTCQCSGPSQDLDVCIVNLPEGVPNANTCAQVGCTSGEPSVCDEVTHRCICEDVTPVTPKPPVDGATKLIGDTCQKRTDCAAIKTCEPGTTAVCAAAVIPNYLTLLEDATKLVQLQDILKERSADPNFLWKKMTTLYAKYDQVDETLSCAKSATARLPLARWSRSDLYEMARFAVRNQQQRWMEDLLSESPGQTNSKAFWVETVCRPFLLNGSWRDAKAAIEKLWEEGHGGKFQAHAWLELAREESDEQLANDVTAYAASQGIPPNERDYLEWLLLKLDKKHLEGAKFSYERLRDVETFSATKTREWAKYQVALNRLLCLSCSQMTPDFPYIIHMLEHVDEVQAYLEPETIAKLSLRFLENEQYLDAMDLLAVHAFKLGESDRQIVQSAFASFCKDPLISTGRAWSAYQVLEQYFPDLECPERVELMEEFFRRKRSDMALAVFAAMRNHRSPAYRPDEKVYRQCFEGFARNPDLESTERVHAWLKTDQSITPSTTLFTALMLAYTAAERPLIALDFWKEITTCKEGPGYGSLAAVFWALEKRSDGAKMARDIWTRIETMDIEVPTYVYSSYAGAIAASGQILEVQKVINNMASYVGTPPEPLTLGIAHNALPNRELQVEFEEWAKSKYRVQWSELAKTGRRMNEFGLCQFKIQRRLKA
ncbi:pentatricopeptide repeat domain-containing protein [Sarocladium implicatum]|nr:pentatricopeptide repeat domain-containing protein [Sarocladium implicatum]